MEPVNEELAYSMTAEQIAHALYNIQRRACLAFLILECAHASFAIDVDEGSDRHGR